MKICIITPDIVGPIRNGGIGTACGAIARLLKQNGQDVTVLYALGDYTETETIAVWQHRYSEEGIELVACPDTLDAIEPYPDVAVAWRVLRWLETRHFDLLYAVEWGGTAGLVALARRAGLGFLDTVLVAGTHSPTLWHIEGQRSLVVDRYALARDHLEQMTVAFADCVITPSQHLLDWMTESGWRLPADTRVIPNPVPAALKTISHDHLGRRPISEIVFFGRLESRKGLRVFVRALELVSPELLARVRVTFLGKFPSESSESDTRQYIARSLPDSLSVAVLNDFDATQAVEYLFSESGRLAVMPSLMENSPMTVVECLARGIPFLASDVGGIPDLLCESDHASHLFRPTPPELAHALVRALSTGLWPAAPRWDLFDIDAAWIDALGQVRQVPHNSGRTAAIITPKVSVVVIHYNRPDTLAQALQGLLAQTFKDFELILVDDGSDQAEAIAFLREIETTNPKFVSGQWRIIRRENGYLGAARNTGWRAARGRYVLFHDDDNVSMEHLLQVMVDAAEYSQADVVTSAMEVFFGPTSPINAPGGSRRKIWVPIGGALSLGAFENCYGDAHALIRRDLLVALGGVSEDYGVGHEDWEFFARACLNGYTLLAVPTPLFWYRVSGDSMLRSRSTPDADYLRSARPYLSTLPPSLRPILLRALSAELQLLVTKESLSLVQSALAAKADKYVVDPSDLERCVREATVSAYSSSSLRRTRLVRNLWARILKKPLEPDRFVPAATSVDEFHRLVRLYSSISWDVMAPMRVLGRIWQSWQGSRKG